MLAEWEFQSLADFETGRIEVNNEPWVHRIITHSISGRDLAFRDGIRARDGRCVISGVVNARAPFDIWSGFEAAYIFPLESESHWAERNYGRWIRDVTPGVAKINSPQNGFLLRRDIHTDFDNYLVSVNPDVSLLTLDLIFFSLSC